MMGAVELPLAARRTDAIPEAGAGSEETNQSPGPETSSTASHPPPPSKDPNFVRKQAELEAGSPQVTMVLDNTDDEQVRRGMENKGSGPSRAKAFTEADPRDRRSGMTQAASRVSPFAEGTTAPPGSPMVNVRSPLRNQDTEAGAREAPSVDSIRWGDKEPQGYLKVHKMQVFPSSH